MMGVLFVVTCNRIELSYGNNWHSKWDDSHIQAKHRCNQRLLVHFTSLRFTQARIIGVHFQWSSHNRFHVIFNSSSGNEWFLVTKSSCYLLTFKYQALGFGSSIGQTSCYKGIAYSNRRLSLSHWVLVLANRGVVLVQLKALQIMAFSFIIVGSWIQF